MQAGIGGEMVPGGGLGIGVAGIIEVPTVMVRVESGGSGGRGLQMGPRGTLAGGGEVQIGGNLKIGGFGGQIGLPGSGDVVIGMNPDIADAVGEGVEMLALFGRDFIIQGERGMIFAEGEHFVFVAEDGGGVFLFDGFAEGGVELIGGLKDGSAGEDVFSEGGDLIGREGGIAVAGDDEDGDVSPVVGV